MHNNFQFKSIIQDENKIVITFLKSEGDWIGIDEYDALIFIHNDVSFFKSSEGDNSQFPEDENILSTISFFPSNLRNINDQFSLNNFSTSQDDIIYYFENDKFFRIKCTEIEIIILEPVVHFK